MSDFALDGTGDSLDLGEGYRLAVPDLHGTVRVSDAPVTGTRGFVTEDFDALLEAAGLRRDRVLDVEATVTRDLHAAAGAAPEATLDVVPPPGDGAVVLLEDPATGAVTWHLPERAREGGVERALEGAAAAPLRFTIPLAAAPGAEGTRGLGDIGRKVLKVFVYPATDALLGPLVRGAARRWEETHRADRVRRFGPDDYQDDRRDFPALAADDWQRLAGGRALLFVHGTFSSSGAFSELPVDVVRALSARYGGRTFAYDHFTLSVDPADNARALLARIPRGVALDVDIVCHSRGGLVARELAALGAADDGAHGTLRVGRIVLVGVPNQGTALADADHMVGMIDRFTNVAKFIPASPVRRTVDALVFVVKALGHGLLEDLTGLRAMAPGGAFLTGLNTAPVVPPSLAAIASDYEPAPGSPLFAVTRAKDAVADRVFGDAPNDLVVPRDGVFAFNGALGFPIAGDALRTFAAADGVIHTQYFKHPRTGQWLLELLGAAEPRGARAVADARGEADDETLAAAVRTLDATRDALSRTLQTRRRALAADGDGDGARAPTPQALQALRPHVVNLSEGAFRRSGRYDTTPQDVDAIFQRHIPEWAATRAADEPLRVVVYAHGGLIGEQDGLAIARKHVDWWKANGVYPIYFVWETGLFDALRSILESVRARIFGAGRRDLWDLTVDPLVERGVRALGGVQVWGAMKRNAELASAAGGGARYLAQRLAEFCRASARPVELHAVGHSAGSIFHSHFLPAARRVDVPPFRTLQLLAPAVRVDTFKEKLAGRVGTDVDQLTIYTMHRALEQADECIGIYHKSLLYLIHHGLEPQPATPVLGLELSLTDDPELRTLLGLDGRTGARGEVVWSQTPTATGRSASRSTSHGGFDDDAATMSSVVARVLGRAAAPVPYTGTERTRDWPQGTDWLQGVDLGALQAIPGPLQGAATAALAATNGATNGDGAGGATSTAASTAPSATEAAEPLATADDDRGARTGRRFALCVGIDAYPGPNRLSGCVNDTKVWGGLLRDTLAFDVRFLTNADATHAAIVDVLRDLVRQARAGDVLVFQYSGHGTQVPDLDGDEADGTDEAFVPVDFQDGAFLLDDDMRAVLAELKEGVAFTCFIDCCHSGTITRMLGRNADDLDDGAKARYLVPTDEDVRAHERFREALAARGAARAPLDRTSLRWVNFSACDATEVALERNGNGDFTRFATAVLRQGLAGITNREFQRRVVAAFGERRRQTPQLDCPPDADALPLLAPRAVRHRAVAAAVAPGIADVASDRRTGTDDRRATADDGTSYSRRASDGRRATDAARARDLVTELGRLVDALGEVSDGGAA